MDVKFINPFVLAAQTVFKTMLGIDTNMGKPIIERREGYFRGRYRHHGACGRQKGHDRISFRESGRHVCLQDPGGGGMTKIRPRRRRCDRRTDKHYLRTGPQGVRKSRHQPQGGDPYGGGRPQRGDELHYRDTLSFPYPSISLTMTTGEGSNVSRFLFRIKARAAGGGRNSTGMGGRWSRVLRNMRAPERGSTGSRGATPSALIFSDPAFSGQDCLSDS